MSPFRLYPSDPRADAELDGGISNLCGNPCPSPPREPLFNQLSLLSTKEDAPQPVKHCPGRLAPPSGPLAQCHAPQGPYDSALPHPSGPELLGPGFYQLQLGPFVTDGMSTESGATKRLQVGFSLPSPPPPSSAVASTVSVTSEFGVISSFLCPRAMHTPPVRHPRSLKQ